mmetsp:Transcript_1546/g.2320  ORF Transcript_1546/g.2320 Transcript_1546/m.2320 type:complete len:89 (-) Transcript_1546:60-326(-)
MWESGSVLAPNPSRREWAPTVKENPWSLAIDTDAMMGQNGQTGRRAALHVAPECSTDLVSLIPSPCAMDRLYACAKIITRATKTTTCM